MVGAAKHQRWRLALLVLLGVGGAWLVFRWLVPPFVPPVLPHPNGYNDLLRAAKMLAPRTGYFSEMAGEELAAVVAQNAPALELARNALRKECMVPVNWSADQAAFALHMENCQSIREIGRAFAAAARRAKIAGMIDEGVACGLDILALSQASARGGLIVDRMVAQAIQHQALQVLRDQVDRLSREACNRLRETIDAFPLQLESPKQFVRRERLFFRQINGALQSILISGVARTQLQQVSSEIESADKRLAALAALLRSHLALRAYQLDNNRFPETLDLLVPEFFRAVPQDSFTTGSLVYRPLADSYQLYSVGPDGVDGGGLEEDAQGDRVDLLLETSE